MDVTGVALLAVLIVGCLAALVVWLRGTGQPVVLRDAEGRSIDPRTLEGDDPADLPGTARDNRYIRTPRFLPPFIVRSGRGLRDLEYDAMPERERLNSRVPTRKDD